MEFTITIKGKASAEEIVAIMKEAEAQMVARDERWAKRTPQPVPVVSDPPDKAKS